MTPALASLEAEIGDLEDRIVRLRPADVPRHQLIHATRLLRMKREQHRALEARTPFAIED